MGLEVAERGEVMVRAEAVAKKWAGQPGKWMREWKKETVRRIEERERRMREGVAGMRESGVWECEPDRDREEREGEEARKAREEKGDSGEIRLWSKVVRATEEGGGIVGGRMEDGQGKNM